MKCPHCGFVNSDYSYRCVKCNKDLANASKFKHPPQPPQTHSPNASQSTKTTPPQSAQNKWKTVTKKTQQFTHTKTTQTANTPNTSGLPDFLNIFKKPSNDIHTYLIHNIIATLFCCMPLGIVGLFYSTNVRHHLDSGNLDEARKSSERAWLFMIIAYGSGILLGFVYLFIQIVAIFGQIR